MHTVRARNSLNRPEEGILNVGFLLLNELLMSQLKIDVLSVLVETDKLEFGEPQASGILSPAYWRGGKFNRAQGVSPGVK